MLHFYTYNLFAFFILKAKVIVLHTIIKFFHISSQVFDDAYKSQLSCVVVDDIERLLG